MASPNINSTPPEAEAHEFRRWVLVAGTGLEHGLAEVDLFAARAIGAELARERYGLISGGWHGVDYVATEAFLRELQADGEDPQDYLIQVIPEDATPSFDAGRVVKIPRGGREWGDAQHYADAVVIIGGLGGSYKTWLGALHGGLPRFPLGGTGGDAAQAYKHTVDMWEVIPVPGLSFEEFCRTGREIHSPADADAVAQDIIGNLLWKSLNAVDAIARRASGDQQAALFISYSRRDEHWVTRLRTLLRPAERRGILSTWVDADLKSGLDWETQIISHMQSSRAALLMVSSTFLASQYVSKIEIPALVCRLQESVAGKNDFRLFWVLLEECDWRSIPGLEHIQAVGGVAAVNKSPTKADEQCRLIKIVEEVASAIEGDRKAPSP